MKLRFSQNSSTITKMIKEHFFQTAAINVLIILADVNVIKCGSFYSNTSSLTVFNEQLSKMDCLNLYTNDLHPVVINLIFKLDILMSISSTFNTDSACQNSVVQINDTRNLEFVLEKCSTYKGILFIILNRKITWIKISAYAEQYWKMRQIYRVIYITPASAKFYHPFLLQNYKNGVLVNSKDYDINKVFGNFYGYPMRVYIFDSVFSEVKAKRDTFKVTRVEGVDAKVAYLLESIFNFTMILQWPDDDFFG